MRDRLARFMMGRYGNDPLNQFIMIVALALIIASFFFQPLYVVALVLLVLGIFRMMSRNVAKRQAEMMVFERARGKFFGFFKGIKNQLFGSKTHKYFKCPGCRQQLRVPRGRGRVSINCPKCHAHFERKS